MHYFLIMSVIRGSLQTDSMLLSAVEDWGQIQVLMKTKTGRQGQERGKDTS